MKSLPILLALALLQTTCFGALLSSVKETNFRFTDITTGDASTTKHGLMPKASGDTNQYYNGMGALAYPAFQATNANLTAWALLSTSAKQDASANLTAWSALATSAKQTASANLTSWSALAPSAKQDTLGYTPVNKAGDTGIGALGLSSYLSLSGTTNRLTVSGGALLVDGAAVGGVSGTTNYFDYTIINNTVITNLTINDSVTINTNVTINQNITVKGNASLTTVTIGSATITNSTTRKMTTSWSPVSASTNYVADLSLPVMQWSMSSALNILHATNGAANFSANYQTESQFKIFNGSGGNLAVTLPSTWKPYGSATTNSFTATNGTGFILAIQFAGSTTSQTNVDYAVVYRTF